MAGYYPPDPRDELIADLINALARATVVLADEIERRGDEDASYVVQAKPVHDSCVEVLSRARQGLRP